MSINRALFAHTRSLTSSPPNGLLFDRSEAITHKARRQELRRVQDALSRVVQALRSHSCTDLCPLLLKRYRDLAYKHGVSSRHQKYWLATKQIIAELRRINETKLFVIVGKVVEGLSRSDCSAAPSQEVLRFIGAAFLERLLRLDRIRFYCQKALQLYMGYIEKGHFLILLFALVSMAADVAAKALRQYNATQKVYHVVGALFHNWDARLPADLAGVILESAPGTTLDESGARDLKLILQLAKTAPVDVNSVLNKFNASEFSTAKIDESENESSSDEEVPEFAAEDSIKIETIEKAALVPEDAVPELPSDDKPQASGEVNLYSQLAVLFAGRQKGSSRTQQGKVAKKGKKRK